MNKPSVKNISPFGESGFLIILNNYGDPSATSLICYALAMRLRALNKFQSVTPGLSSVGVQFDADILSPKAACAVLEDATALIEGMDMITADSQITIPVCYEEPYALDLSVLSETLNISREQIIDHHRYKTVRVLNMGFAPGFAYLGPMPDILTLPRRTSPRTLVPRGSVGLAAGFSGLYSLPSPGGWHIIGRTPVRLFDSARTMPFLLQPNMEVTFDRIDAPTFRAMAHAPGGVDGS